MTRTPVCNSGLAKVAVSFSADTFVVNQTLVLRIKFSAKNHHLRQNVKSTVILLMTKIYSYVLRIDNGAAPNAFGQFCTLTICKPAIRRNAEIGDWVIG